MTTGHSIQPTHTPAQLPDDAVRPAGPAAPRRPRRQPATPHPGTHPGSRPLSRRVLLTGSVSSIGLALLAACGSGGTDSKTADGSGKDGKGGKTITVVAHDSFSVSEELLEAYQKENGVVVEVIASGSGAELVNKLVLTKDAPLGDVFFGVDNTYASRALAEGVVDADYAPQLPAGAEAYLVDGSTALAPIDFGEVCLNVDSQWFQNKGLTPPASFEDLLKPEYKDLTVVLDPSTSTPGMAFLLATIGHFGTDGWEQYWKDLVANGARIDSGWSEAYNTDFSAGEGAGAYPVVVSYSSSPSYTVTKDGTSTTTAAVLSTAFRQVEYAGVLAGAKNPEGGKAFIEWLLSTAVQEDIPGSMYMYPVSTQAALPADLEKFGPLSTSPVTVPAADITAHREEWLEAWTAAVGK